MDEIRRFILECIEKEYSIEGVECIDDFNYVDSGYIDSIGLLGFIADIEDRYGISFTEEELDSEEFKVIGTLAEMIYDKIEP